MNGKFYIKKLIRDDGTQLVFDESEIYLDSENVLLNRSPISSTDAEYTDTDGGEMIAQRRPSFDQVINGLIIPRMTDYWTLYQQLSSFFAINHTYRIITAKKSGIPFAQQQSWIADGGGLQIVPQPYEDYSRWTVTMRIGNAALYEYTEDAEGNEILSNHIALPLLALAEGGEKWDSIGQVWDSIGEVWEAGTGGVQTVFIDSVSRIYPIWTVEGESINPSLQNNTTDTVATYSGTVGVGQTLVVDFATGEARLNGTLVSRNLTGQVSCQPGNNVMGFNATGGTTETSDIGWNNVIG